MLHFLTTNPSRGHVVAKVRFQRIHVMWLHMDGVMDRSVVGHNMGYNLLHVATLWRHAVSLAIGTYIYNMYIGRDCVQRLEPHLDPYPFLNIKK